MNVISIEDVAKRYDSQNVLRDFYLKVEAGQVYGLLGPNGAGKSTLIHLLMGFLKPDKGTILVFDDQPGKQKSRVGYLPERLRYHTHCSGREYLKYMANFSDFGGDKVYGRIQHVLNLVKLQDDADRKMKDYSKGMLQRIGIAQALLTEPELLLVDEPSSGLDPSGQYEIQEILNSLSQEGHTILICSHQLDEIAEVCDRVGILVDGQIAAETDLETLPGQSGITIMLEELPTEDIDYALRSISSNITREGRRITVPQTTTTLQKYILQTLLDEGYTVSSLQPTIGTLRDLYLHVVKGNQAPPEALPTRTSSLLNTLLAEEEDTL